MLIQDFLINFGKVLIYSTSQNFCKKGQQLFKKRQQLLNLGQQLFKKRQQLSHLKLPFRTFNVHINACIKHLFNTNLWLSPLIYKI